MSDDAMRDYVRALFRDDPPAEHPTANRANHDNLAPRPSAETGDDELARFTRNLFTQAD